MFNFTSSPVRPLVTTRGARVEVNEAANGVTFVLRNGFIAERFNVPGVSRATLLEDLVSSMWTRGLHEDAKEFLKIASTEHLGGSFAKGLEHLETTLESRKAVDVLETIADRLKPWVMTLPPQKRGGVEVFFDAYDYARHKHGVGPSTQALPEPVQFNPVGLMAVSSPTTPITSESSTSVSGVATQKTRKASDAPAPAVKPVTVAVPEPKQPVNAIHMAIQLSETARLPSGLFPPLTKDQLNVQHQPSQGGVDENTAVFALRSIVEAIGFQPNDAILEFFRGVNYMELFDLSAAYGKVNGLVIEDNLNALFLCYFVTSDTFNKLALIPSNGQAVATILDLVQDFEPGCVRTTSVEAPATEATKEEVQTKPEAPSVKNHLEAANNLSRRGKKRQL